MKIAAIVSLVLSASIAVAVVGRPAEALSNCTTAGADLTASEAHAVVLFNQHRAALGLAPVKVSPSLNRMAAWMATDQRTRVGLSHTDSLGRDPWRRAADCDAVALGEIAAVTGTDPQTTVTAWLNSPGHRAIIEGPYRMVGVGNDGGFWTANFGNVDDSVTLPTPTPIPTPTPARRFLPMVASDGPFVLAESLPEPTPEPIPDPRIASAETYLIGRVLAPYAAVMVAEADAYGVDWRMIPVLSVLESSGGRNACGFNAWGVASCAIQYASWDEGIADVAGRLSLPPYAGLSTREKFCMWQSGTICATWVGADYAARAMYEAEKME